LLGQRAAMACTVAVEEVITEHYNSQLRVLHERADTKEEEALRQVCFVLVKENDVCSARLL
jgi:ubiquinone biosynthesis monooxygenase Coq7